MLRPQDLEVAKKAAIPEHSRASVAGWCLNIDGVEGENQSGADRTNQVPTEPIL
jgi:hypothetical protein